jgi:hypothetical protein
VLPAASWLTLGRIRGPELLEQFVGPPGRRAPSEVEEPARHDQVLPAGQDVVDRRLLAGEADPAAHRGRLACDVEARDLRAPPSARSRVASTRTTVVLPAPLGPSSPHAEPSATADRSRSRPARHLVAEALPEPFGPDGISSGSHVPT